VPRVVTVGELLVEVMRKDVDVPLGRPADFVGPFPSGAPAIFADAVARLGTSSGIIGAVGRDEFGDCVLGRLEGDGVDTSAVKRVGDLPTGVAFVSYRSDGSRKFIFHMGNSAAGAITASDVPEDYVRGASVVHINGSSLAMGAGMREACYRAVEVGRRSGARISFDPNIRRELGSEGLAEVFSPVLDSCTLLIPTADELAELCGTREEDEAAGMMLDRGVEVVAVKDGRKGCRIYTRDSRVEAPAFEEVEAVDPTGAGDAFSAAVVVGYLEGMDPSRLAVFANAAGSCAVSARGPMEGLAWRDRIEEMVRRSTSGPGSTKT